MQYDACVVPRISWSLGKRVFLSFIVSLSFYRYRYRYTEIVSVRYFLSYRFQTIIPKLSVRYPPQTFISSVFPTPFLLFSCPLFWLSLYSFCSNNTIHIQTGVHSPMLSGVGNDTHQTTSQSGPTAVGAGGPFLLLYIHCADATAQHLKGTLAGTAVGVIRTCSRYIHVPGMYRDPLGRRCFHHFGGASLPGMLFRVPYSGFSFI